MNEMPNCIGCGTTIQTEDKTAVGYAPPSSLEKTWSFANVASV